MDSEVPSGMQSNLTVKEIVGNLTPQVRKEIGIIDFALMHSLVKEYPDRAIVQGNAELLIMADSSFPDRESVGISATTLNRFLKSELSPEQAQKIGEVLEHSKNDSPLVKALNSQLDQLDERAVSYFANPKTNADYYLPSSLQQEVADLVLNLGIAQKAEQLQREFQAKQLGQNHAEAFRDPNSNMLGLWMSNQGLHFDAKKLKSVSSV